MTTEKLERLAPRVFRRLGVVVLPGRVGKGVPDSGLDVDFVVFAQPLERPSEALD